MTGDEFIHAYATRNGGLEMTKDEFIHAYAARSSMTPGEATRGLVAMRCFCGDEECNGWAMVGDYPVAAKGHLTLYGYVSFVDTVMLLAEEMTRAPTMDDLDERRKALRMYLANFIKSGKS